MFRSGFYFDSVPYHFALYGEEILIFLLLGVLLAIAEVFLFRKKGKRLWMILPVVLFGCAVVKFVVRAVRYHPALEDLCFALLVESVPALWLLAVCALYKIGCLVRAARRADRHSLDRTRIIDL